MFSLLPLELVSPGWTVVCFDRFSTTQILFFSAYFDIFGIERDEYTQQKLDVILNFGDILTHSHVCFIEMAIRAFFCLFKIVVMTFCDR